MSKILRQFWTFVRAHYKWLLVAVVMPFMTFGTFLGWEALTPYHTSEQERALDIAPFYFAFAGGSMAVPSMIGVVVALLVAVFVFHLGPVENKKRAIGRLLISTLFYAVFMALVYGVTDGWMFAYGPMEQHQTEAYKRNFFMERVTVNLFFWTLINWIATLLCMALISLVSRFLPRKISRLQKWVASVTPIIACLLILWPPWWVHDYVLLPGGDETTGAYYEGYLGHAPLWNAPPVHKFMGTELDPGMCTQLLILELLLLILGAVVLWNIAAIKQLRWRSLNKMQRGSVIIGAGLLVAALVYPPWWSLSGKGYFWGEREPMSFLGYAAVINPPKAQHGRLEIIWPLVALEAYLVALTTGAVICLLKGRDRREEGTPKVDDQDAEVSKG